MLLAVVGLLAGLELAGGGAAGALAASWPADAGATAGRAAVDPLEQRLAAWPHWNLPAPLLSRPGREAELIWPAWFGGRWQVQEEPAGDAEPLRWQARFRSDGHGGAVAERTFNAGSLGRAALGEALLSVEEDPAHPNRQLSRLRGDRLLETTVVGRRSLQPDPGTFLADELSLQVLHGPGSPRIQRVEVLGRWRLQGDGRIEGEQWVASYGSPADGLAAAGERPQHLRLRLDPLPQESDRAR